MLTRTKWVLPQLEKVLLSPRQLHISHEKILVRIPREDEGISLPDIESAAFLSPPSVEDRGRVNFAG